MNERAANEFEREGMSEQVPKRYASILPTMPSTELSFIHSATRRAVILSSRIAHCTIHTFALAMVVPFVHCALIILIQAEITHVALIHSHADAQIHSHPLQ